MKQVFVRTALLALLVCVAIVGAGGAVAAGKPAHAIVAADALELDVLAQLNAVRREHGLTPLKLNVSLSNAADAHSRAMGQWGFFGHDSRDGSVFWKRVKHYYGQGRFGTWSVGENLLWSSPTTDGRGALELWMASPGHRKNILTARWHEVGISAVTVAQAPGVFGGRDVTIVATDFGVRS